MGLDLTSFDAALKQHYTSDRIENMVYKDNPLHALMPKMETFGGRNLPIVTVWGNPQGRSRSFTQAQKRGQATSSKVDDFLLTRVKDYSIAYIDNETLEASKGDPNAFMEAATTEIDGAINSLTRSLAVKEYRAGYGEIGKIGAINGAVVTLEDPDEITNLEVGMELDLSASLTGANKAYGTNAHGLYVVAVNRSTGEFTCSANVTDAGDGIPTATVGDFIFVAGDHDGATRSCISGLEAWVPDEAPDSTPFFGVDRSQDTRLGGLRYDASNMPIEEGLIDAASVAGRDGGRIDHYFMNFAKYSNLEKALGSKVQYVDLQANAYISFQGILINGPKGIIKVIPDQNCQPNKAWGLNLPTWKLYSLGKAVRVIDTDGLQMLRQATADGVECRYGYYANMGSRAPGWNVNVTL